MSKAASHPLISAENCQKIADLQMYASIPDVNLLIRDALAVYASAYTAIASGQGFGVINFEINQMQLYETPTMKSAHVIAKARAQSQSKFRKNVANDSSDSGIDVTKIEMESLIPEPAPEPATT